MKRTFQKLFLVSTILANTGSLDAGEPRPLRPRCDTVSVTFVGGSSTHVRVLNLPYQEEYARIPGLTQHPILGTSSPIILYRRYDGGPKVDLETQIALVKAGYGLKVGFAQSAYMLCITEISGSYLSQVARCEARFPRFEDPLQDLAREGCETRAKDELLENFEECKRDRDDDFLRLVTDANSDIHYQIDAYEGCDSLPEHVRLWETYWGNQQNR